MTSMKNLRICPLNLLVYWPIAITLILGLLQTGCAKIRLITYPDNFVWVDQQVVRGTMQTMYQSMQRLDFLLENEIQSEDTAFLDQRQDEVVRELQTLEVLASNTVAGISSRTNVDSDKPVTNHLLIDEHMDDFINRISQARLRAEAEPPRYFKVGELVGECNACHRQR